MTLDKLLKYKNCVCWRQYWWTWRFY